MICMKPGSLILNILLFLCLCSCDKKLELKDFIGDYNTAYSQSRRAVNGEEFKRVYFNDLMPIKISLFTEAQTNLVKGRMRISYNNYVTIVNQFTKENIYELDDFQMLNDTLAFTFGRGKLTGQIIKFADSVVLGLDRKFMNPVDLASLPTNPLYITEKNEVLYFKILNSANEKKLYEDYYTFQIEEWRKLLTNPSKKEEAETHINYLQERREFMDYLH